MCRILVVCSKAVVKLTLSWARDGLCEEMVAAIMTVVDNSVVSRLQIKSEV